MTRYNPPSLQYGELFLRVQSGRLFPDSKTFADALPRSPAAEIMAQFEQQRDQPDFNLAQFVDTHFQLPEDAAPGTQTSGEDSSPPEPIRQRMDRMWDVLTRTDTPEEIPSSRLVLPRPYLVPGGRFRELYYWDSYFTLLGLAACGRIQAMKDMVDNFSFLIGSLGFVPNSARSYHCSRSQPPFFSLMVESLASTLEDEQVWVRYLPALKKEYAFWMDETDTPLDSDAGRLVKTAGFQLNRYWDSSDQPRDESYAEDLELARHGTRTPAELFRDLRAACESGWDFSSRWLADGKSLASIQTTRILPIDLNCLLHHLESVLARACTACGETEEAAQHLERARKRKTAVRSLFFRDEPGFFFDLLIDTHEPTGAKTLAAAFPLAFGLATPAQAQAVASILEAGFLRPGGWVTSNSQSGQQWDAPNGWAPLQWVVFTGLNRYGFGKLAREGARRWLETVENTYRTSGRLLEKYNVEFTGELAGGGEYAVQDGFGWTNGVYLCLADRASE